MKKNLLFAACLAAFSAASLFGQKSETRSLGDFSEVASSGNFYKVTLREGDKTEAKITTDGGSLDHIRTEIEGKTLKIYNKNAANYSKERVEIVVTFRRLSAIANSGSSDIELVSTVKTDKFKFANSGSGDFKGLFDVQKLEASLSGSGNAQFRGRAEEQEISISGSADIDASSLSGRKADVSISGSGNVQLGVEDVRSSVSGSGRITNNH